MFKSKLKHFKRDVLIKIDVFMLSRTCILETYNNVLKERFSRENVQYFSNATGVFEVTRRTAYHVDLVFLRLSWPALFSLKFEAD